jgi:formylglycine-generating enzyme required for sulfatase activity
MKRQILTVYIAAAVLFASSCLSARAGTVNIDLVPVGDVMNLADSATGFGSVGYSYSMGKYDVTTSQYVEFLNSVATTADPYALFNANMSTDLPTVGITRTSTSAGFSYAVKGNGNVPVFDVTWVSAARFCNWLANSQPTGPEGPSTTETGSYALNGSTGSTALMAVTRSSTATWLLPTDNEWYKAAYYVGGGTNARYWIYPTQSNSQPSNVLSATGTNNANYDNFGTLTDPVNRLTAVGAFAASPGPYGTFDQGGNVDEWEESLEAGVPYRDIRGGSWADSVGTMRSFEVTSGPMETPSVGVGFRVEYVPEPRGAAMLSVAALVAGLCHTFHQLMKRERSQKCRADSFRG